MATLERTEACGYPIAKAYTVAQLEAMTDDERIALLAPTESLFAELQAVRLPAFYEKLCRSGCEIYLKKIGVSLPVGVRVRILDASGEFFALGETKEYESGVAVKAIKTFSLE